MLDTKHKYKMLKFKTVLINLIRLCFNSFTLLLLFILILFARGFGFFKYDNNLTMLVFAFIFVPIAFIWDMIDLDKAFSSGLKFTDLQIINIFFIISSLYTLPIFFIDLIESSIKNRWISMTASIFIIYPFLIYVNSKHVDIIFKKFRQYNDKIMEITVTLLCGISWDAIILRYFGFILSDEPVEKFFFCVPLAITMFLFRIDPTKKYKYKPSKQLEETIVKYIEEKKQEKLKESTKE